MSMIAANKLEKTQHLKFLFSQLWQGETAAALEYLKYHVALRNQDKWQELIGYLEKHQPEIINYKRRSQVGKTIGSGRVEKGVDLTVGQRRRTKSGVGATWVAEPQAYLKGHQYDWETSGNFYSDAGEILLKQR